MAKKVPVVEEDAQNLPVTASALALQEHGPGRSFAEKLALGFYKLTWRTPIKDFVQNNKTPLRLLATPADPLSVNVARGKALIIGQFHFNGMRLKLSEIDYGNIQVPPAMANYIHRFAWLRDLAAAANRGEAASIAAPVTDHWIDGAGTTIAEPAWSVENCAWRLLNMASGAPLILSSVDPVYRARVINHLGQTAKHLDTAAPKGESKYARLCGWAGVVAASLLLPDGKARRLVGEAELANNIQETVFDDGGIVSRSPIQLIELIELLSLLRQAYLAQNQDIPSFLTAALGRSVPALLGLSHADGGLGAWQGSAHISPATINAVIEASGVRGRPQRQALDWGYQRVSAGESVLLLDAGPPPLAKQSAAGCASTLAFEFSHGSHRLVVNCGGSALVGATIPATLARGLRTTAAHSTLCIDDSNSTSILPGGELGRGVEEVGLDRRDIEKATRIEGSHDGYSRAYGFTHSRILILRSDGMELRGEDTLLPNGKVSPKDDVPCHIRFHLGPNIELAAGNDGRSIVMRLADGTSWLFFSSAGELDVDESLWVDEYGTPHPGQQIIIAANAGKGGLTVGWQIRFLG